MANNINCTCGHSWSKASSSKKDMYVCHICGKDNTMQDGGWLNKFEQGGMNLEQKDDNYGTKPNPNNVQASVGPDFVGLGYDTTGRNYSPAWGGQFEDGGNVAQGGKSIPTMADSLALYNTSKKVLDYYKDKKYKDYTNIDYKKKELYKRYNKEALAAFTKLNKTGGIKVPTDGGKKSEIKTIPEDSYYKKLDANRYLQRERFYGALDTKAPMQLFDNRITPTLQSFYANEKVDDPLYEDNVSIYSYDPILVKPVSMLTSKERALRLKRYGKESGLTDEKVKVSTSTEKSKIEPEKKKTEVVKKSEETKLIKPTKTEETKPAPYTPKGSKKYIVNGVEVSEEDFLGTGITTGGSKRIIYSTPKIKDRKVLRSDGTPETDPEKIRKAIRAQEKDDDMAMGGSLPGAVGFTYARTAGSAPSNGKYAKKTKASAQNGKEMKFYQEGLDFKPNSIAQDGGQYFFMNLNDEFNTRMKNIDYVKGEYNKGMDFHNKWLNSPMYNSMINASDPINAKQITDQRKDRLSAVRFNYVDNPYKAGASTDQLGNIEVYPAGIGNKGVGVHEMSHVTDTGPGQNLIPAKDRIDISRYSLASENMPKYEANEEYFNYVTKPSETRARLNEIRQGASENKLYDPFTQKVNPAIYNKLKNFKFNSKPGDDPLQQLKSAYSDKQILEMLNSVSKNKDRQQQTTAQDGKEVTYTHQPGMLYDNFEPIGPGEKYMLKRTVTPYTSKRDIKKFTQAPTDPRQVNFLSNYAGATGEPLSKGFEYPTSVPYEGEKHWNIDRFIIDPQFETSEKLNTAESTKGEMKKNVLADMYKYFMLQNKGDRDDAWKQANKFVRQEINPRVKGEVYDEYLRKNLPIPNIMGITSLVDNSYLQKYNSVRDRTLSETTDDDDAFTELMQKNPLSKGKAFRVGMDWLMNYKGLSRKEAKKTLNKTKELPKFEQSDAEPMDMDPSKWKDGGAIVDPMGQWAHPGEVTIIPSTDITMEGVDYPVLGISDTGDQQMMYPGEDYQFDGDYVTEYPMMKEGGWLSKFDTAQSGGTFMDKVDADIAKLLGPNTDKNRSRGDIASYFSEIRKAQQKPENDKAIAQNEQKIKKQILAQAVANAKGKQETVKQDNRTPRQKEIAQQQLVNLTMDEAQRNSPLAQTFSSFTPTGDNPEAGKIFAKQFVDATPPMAMLRLMNAARDVKNNPYGIGQGNGFLANTLGTLGLVGDVLDVGVVTAPGVRAAGKYLTEQTPLRNASKFNPYALTDDILFNKEGVVNRQIFGDDAYNQFLEYGPTTRPNISQSDQMMDLVRAPKSDVISGSGEVFQVAKTMEDGAFKYPYFQEGSLWYTGQQRSNLAKELGKERIITTPTSDIWFAPAGESSVMLGDDVSQGLIDSYSKGRRVLMPGASEYAKPSKYSVFEPHWWKGYKEVTQPGGVATPNLGSAIEQSTPLKNISEIETTSPNVKSPWEPQELPGLHLSSTMEGGPISKIVEPKTGLVNVEQALGIIAKESGGASKASLIKKALGKDTPKKMDYNDFRKTVQDQLIPLEREVVNTFRSAYNIDKLGYTKASGDGKDIILNRINNTKEEIRGLEASGESNDYLDILKANLEIDLRDYNNLPLENQTIRLSNKDKFGRGSDVHGNPEETLGHIHFLRDAESPDILTMTQLQSDAFQSTNRTMPKSLEEANAKLNKLKDDVNYTYKTFGNSPADLQTFKDVINKAKESLSLEEASVKNFSQKSLLDKNHQERYLQELVDYAGKRGDINKIRVPTSETAAKVQGYRETSLTGDNAPGFGKLQEEISIAVRQGDQQKVNDLMKVHDEMLKTPYKTYSSDQKTILKKYSEQPKVIKKVFGVEPKIVTDSKGNTWYEFDIPDKFKGGAGEIKAFKDGGWLTKYK